MLRAPRMATFAMIISKGTAPANGLILLYCYTVSYTIITTSLNLKRFIYMGVSKNRGTPKWMVKIMENPLKMDDLGGKTHYFRKHPYINRHLSGVLKFPQASSALACHVVSEGLAFDLTAAKKLDGLRWSWPWMCLKSHGPWIHFFVHEDPIGGFFITINYIFVGLDWIKLRLSHIDTVLHATGIQANQILSRIIES